MMYVTELSEMKMDPSHWGGIVSVQGSSRSYEDHMKAVGSRDAFDLLEVVCEVEGFWLCSRISEN